MEIINKPNPNFSFRKTLKMVKSCRTEPQFNGAELAIELYFQMFRDAKRANHLQEELNFRRMVMNNFTL